jgi:chromosome partitioning protein
MIEQRLQSFDRGGVMLTIIDTAGGLSAATTAAIRHADLCLIPARPNIADIEATASTLSIARAWNTPFAFVLNQTPIRGQRVSNAATSLADEAALDLAGVVAQPFIVMRNDHQDALSGGLAVSEYAPASKSADEVDGLWQWVEKKLNLFVLADEPEPQLDAVFPVALDVAPTAYLQASAETAAAAS